MPGVLPWLGVLMLFTLKGNRTMRAWWLWAAVGCGFAFKAMLPRMMSAFPSQPMDIFCDMVVSITFGLAAFWLMAGKLAMKNRFLSFLAMLGIVGGFGVATLLCNQDWSELLERITNIGQMEFIFTAVAVGMAALSISVALMIAALFCRGWFRPVRLTFVSLCGTLLMCFLCTLPFLVLALVSNPGSFRYLEFLEAVLLLAGITFVCLAPFLALSYASRFYRDRLKGLLHLVRTVDPPVIAADAVMGLAAGQMSK